MRLFIAIDMPGSMLKEISRVQEELIRLSESGRFVPIQNMHVTLSFLGETDNLVGAVKAMERAVMGMRVFNLNLGEYSFFDRYGSKTSYIQVKGDMHELNALHESLVAALLDEGFCVDRKRYTPHITLGRNVMHDLSVAHAINTISPRPNATMSVREIVLFESVRTARGMVYTPLHKAEF